MLCYAILYAFEIKEIDVSHNQKCQWLYDFIELYGVHVIYVIVWFLQWLIWIRWHIWQAMYADFDAWINDMD